MASKKRRQLDEEDEEEEEVEDDDADEDYEDKGDEADEEEDEEYEDEDSEEEEDGGKGDDGGDEDESEDEVEPAIQQSRREVRQQHAEEKLGSMTENDEEYSFYIVAELDEAQLFSACKTYSIIVCTNYTTNTTRYHAASRSTTQHYAALRSTTQHHAASRSITQHRAALRSITQHYAASRSITQCHVASCSIKQHIIHAHNIITITSQLTLASRDLIHQRPFCRLTTQSFKAPTRILPPSCSLNKSNNLLYRIQPLTQLQMAPPQTIPIQIQMPTQIQMAPQQLQLQLQRTQIITTTSSTITTDLL